MQTQQVEMKFSTMQSLILVVGFIACMVLPLCKFFITPTEQSSTQEKRLLAKAPHISTQGLLRGSYQRELDAYLTDHFGFRGSLVKANALLHVFGLRTSPVSSVVVGRDNWLMYAGEGALDDYRLGKKLSESELSLIAKSLENTATALKDSSILFALLIAPDKHSVYPEQLPFWIPRAHDTSRYDQVVSYLREHTQVLVVDPREALQSAKSNDQLYHRLDTHWNDEGAFIAADALLDALRKNRPEILPLVAEDYQQQVKVFPDGDLATTLSLQGVLTEEAPAFEKIRASCAQKISVAFDWQFEQPPYATTCPEQKVRAVFFRDSFITAMQPFLSEQFGRAVYVKTDDVLLEIIAQEHPDIVVLEIAERYVTKLLVDDPFLLRKE